MPGLEVDATTGEVQLTENFQETMANAERYTIILRAVNTQHVGYYR